MTTRTRTTPKARPAASAWKKLGYVPVDSGEVIIADPEYTHDLGFNVRFTPGWGDGNYPVYGREDEGRLVEVRILCDLGSGGPVPK